MHCCTIVPVILAIVLFLFEFSHSLELTTFVNLVIHNLIGFQGCILRIHYGTVKDVEA